MLDAGQEIIHEEFRFQYASLAHSNFCLSENINKTSTTVTGDTFASIQIGFVNFISIRVVAAAYMDIRVFPSNHRNMATGHQNCQHQICQHMGTRTHKMKSTKSSVASTKSPNLNAMRARETAMETHQC